MDIWGPLSISSFHGRHYFLTVVDDFSKFTWIFLLHNKSETKRCITHFIDMVSTQFSAKIKIIRTDNGLEFHMPTYYTSLATLHQ